MNYDINNEFNKDSDFFLLKMIRGDYGLFKTYWYFSCLPISLIYLIINKLHGRLPNNIEISIQLFVYIYSILTYFGIWKSSNNYSGKKIWPILSKISVIFGSIGISLSLMALLSSDSYQKINNNTINKNLDIVNVLHRIEDKDMEFIKYDTDNYILILRNIQKNTKRNIISSDEFYYDNNRKTLKIYDDEISTDDILKLQNLPMDTIHLKTSVIYLKNGDQYTSNELYFYEIALLIFAPEYANQINFFKRASKVSKQ